MFSGAALAYTTLVAFLTGGLVWQRTAGDGAPTGLACSCDCRSSAADSSAACGWLEPRLVYTFVGGAAVGAVAVTWARPLLRHHRSVRFADVGPSSGRFAEGHHWVK